MSKFLPKGRILRLQMDVVLPETASAEEVQDWVLHEAAGIGGISVDNPLIDREMDILSPRIEDTGLYAYFRIEGLQGAHGGGARWRMITERREDVRGPEEVRAWLDSGEVARRARKDDWV